MHRTTLKALAVLGLFNILTAPSADAGLCRKKNGTIVLRDACTPKESVVTANMLGLDAGDGQGPKGDRGQKGDPGAPGPKGDTGPTGEKGDPALASAIYRHQVPQATIGDASGDGLAVASIALPAGRWLVMARLDAVNFGLPTFVRCFMDVGTYRAQMATSFIGHTATDTAGAVETMSFLLPVDAGQGVSVAIRCRPDLPTGNAAATYIEQGIIVAVPAEGFALQP